MSMKLLRSTWVGVALLSSALIAPATGCGDDDEDPIEEESDGGAGKGDGGKGGSSGKGSAGKGGAGNGGKGGAGKGGSSGGGAGKGGSVTCGGDPCTPNSVLSMISNTMACCTEDDKCGQTNSEGECKQQEAPGELDSACPTVDVEFNGMNYPQMGCCTPAGKCGGLFMQTGFGCLTRGELLPDQGGPLDDISCGGGDAPDAGPSDSDAGN